MPIPNKPENGIKGRSKWVQVYVGLGGNIGDVVSNMVAALDALHQQKDIRVVARSHLYSTPPWGDIDQPDFVNACALIETCLLPEEILKILKDEEKRLKRKKTRRWGPRVIELDILVFGEISIDTPILEIPHPRMTERAFVLKPMSELNASLYVNGKTIRQWLAEADISGIKKLEDQSGWSSGSTISSTT